LFIDKLLLSELNKSDIRESKMTRTRLKKELLEGAAPHSQQLSQQLSLWHLQ
jgi:hypothetical protein